MLPMLTTMVGYWRQDTIIYIVPSYIIIAQIEMKYPLLRACHIFGRSGEGTSPYHFSKTKYFLYLWAHLHNLKGQTMSVLLWV